VQHRPPLELRSIFPTSNSYQSQLKGFLSVWRSRSVMTASCHCHLFTRNWCWHAPCITHTVAGEAITRSPVYLKNMKSFKTQISGKEQEWEQTCEQLASAKLPFALTHFVNEQVPICMGIAKQHGYKLQTPPAEPKVCHFMPTNYGASKITTPDVFSGNPEDCVM
jgi:hypothetical protein